MRVNSAICWRCFLTRLGRWTENAKKMRDLNDLASFFPRYSVKKMVHYACKVALASVWTGTAVHEDVPKCMPSNFAHLRHSPWKMAIALLRWCSISLFLQVRILPLKPYPFQCQVALDRDCIFITQLLTENAVTVQPNRWRRYYKMSNSFTKQYSSRFVFCQIPHDCKNVPEHRFRHSSVILKIKAARKVCTVNRKLFPFRNNNILRP